VNIKTVRPSALVLLTAAILALTSFLKIEGSVGPFRISPVDIFPPTAREKGNWRNTGVEDRTAAAKDLMVSTQKKKVLSGPNDERGRQHPVEGNGGDGPLAKFFQALYETERHGGKLRIAHFGDSIIEGDLISQDLRNNLAKRFGGQGVGFVPITSVAARSRGSVSHEFSSNWKVLSIHPKLSPTHPPGLSGFAFLAQPCGENCTPGGPEKIPYEHSWVRYEASRLFENTGSFTKIKLYYGDVDRPAFIRYALDNEGPREMELAPGKGVRELELDGGPSKKVRIDFYTSGQLPVYGVSFEADRGIYIDNYSIRGYSGLTLGDISDEVVAGFNFHFRYKLIILQYGANLVGYTTEKQVNWYKRQLVAAIEHLKASFPEASILVVSVHDISARKGPEVQTKPCVPVLVAAQKEAAEQAGVAFWNLYEAMGGENSMAGWVAGKKPLANKDLIHFNHRGAKAVAGMLTNVLMGEYEKYKKGLPIQETGRAGEKALVVEDGGAGYELKAKDRTVQKGDGVL